MSDLLRVYRRLLQTDWATVLEYRAQAVLWIISGVFPLVMMVVWLAIVDAAGPVAGMGRTDFIAYYVGAAIVYQFTFVWVIWRWDEDIRTGGLSVKLLKPLDPFHYLVSEQIGWKMFILLTVVPLVAVVSLLVPELRYPLTPFRVVAFLLSIIAGFTLSMLIASAFGVMAFWSTQIRNVYSLWFGVGQFLSGWIAPLALFPEQFRAVANLLPFRSLLGFPLEILMGQLSTSEVGFGFAVTGAYILLFLVLYRVLWHAGLQRYEAVGA